MQRFDHLLAILFAEPVAIVPAVASWLVSLRGMPDKDAEARLTAVSRPRQQSRASGPAVVHVRGLLVREPSLWTEMGFASSMEEIGRQIDALAADPSVPAIVLDIDSPGGSVSGTPELGARIAAARKVKKVVAVITGTYAASAAYWVASQASEVVISPGSEAGSVGVVMMHVDESEYLRQLGVKVSFVTAGSQKVAGNSFSPLDESGRAEYQRRVDAGYSDFVKAVADGRNVTQGKVRDEWGARLFPAKQAVAFGLANRIGTLEDVFAKLSGTSSASASAATGLSREREIEIARMRARMDEGDRQVADIEIRRRRMILNRGETFAVAAKPVGPPPLVNPRPTYTAYHEAGHLVVAVALGDKQAHASIAPDAETYGRVVRVKRLGPIDEAAVCYAGGAGGALSPERAVPGGGDPCWLDDVYAVERCGFSEGRRIGRDKARQLVGQYSREIKVVANELLARKTCSGSFVLKLLNGL